MAALRLTDDPEDELTPDFSPDSKQIAFLAGSVFPVHHFHGGRMDRGGPSTSLGNPVTAQGFLYERTEATGNLWRLTR